MRSFISFLSLPSALLPFLCASPVTSEPAWPYNLPRHIKYFPEDEIHVKRSLGVQERLQREKPVGVRKMSTDEGEMFFLDNWIFEGAGAGRGQDNEGDNAPEQRHVQSEEYQNISAIAFPPLRPHSESSLLEPHVQYAERADIVARAFRCPEGTNNCASIGAPDSCCSISDTCISVQDTGFGTVGCCPQGTTCAGSISCDTRNGYSSCPNSPNGGCCLPGYSCQGVGCVIAGTSVVVVRPSTTSSRTSLTSTTVVVVPTTPNPPRPSTPLSCVSGWSSCPASLGGGCCRDGVGCASGTTCTESSSRASSSVPPSAPVRPTSGSTSAPPTSRSPSPSSSESWRSLCPTGFYACSAYYPNGCCRIGRDCQTTSTCVPTSSGTIVNSNGVTIVAPSGASFATTARTQGGSCPVGWYSCAASLGGNCCLNGYACGEQCTATSGGGTQVAGKVAPSTATVFSQTSIWGLVISAASIGIAAIVL